MRNAVHAAQAVAKSPATVPPQRRPSSSTLDVQRKPLIGPVDDPLEREADRIADAVAAGGLASPVSSATPGRPQRRCATCLEAERDGGELCQECAGTIRRQAESEKPEEEDELRLKPADHAAGGAATAASVAADAVSSGGRPMPAALRAYFEPRFGRDLSAVRIHDDARAGRAAEAIKARAYAFGRHIAFAPGEYDSTGGHGRHLLAHELAHVVQQTGHEAPLAAGGLLQQKTKDGKTAERRAKRRASRAGRKAKRQVERAKRREKRTTGFPPAAEQSPAFADETERSDSIEPTTEGSPLAEFSLQGEPTAALEPKLTTGIADPKMLIQGFDFSLQAHFKASGQIRVTGGSDKEVSDWEAGFLQTIVSSKHMARYLSGNIDRKKACIGVGHKLPANIRDGDINGTPPWYAKNSTKSFVAPDSTIQVDMEDHPYIGLRWHIKEGSSLDQLLQGWGPLDVTCGKMEFGTWLVVKHKDMGGIMYLYSWQWQVDFGGDFLANAEQATNLAEQSPPIGASGIGALKPQLGGPVAQPALAPPIAVSRQKCRPCDEM